MYLQNYIQKVEYRNIEVICSRGQHVTKQEWTARHPQA